MNRLHPTIQQATRVTPEPWWLEALFVARDLLALAIIVLLVTVAAWLLMAVWLSGAAS